MFDVETFTAQVLSGIVNDKKAETGKRDARWVPATEIPLPILDRMGYKQDDARHPHKVQGLGWDLGVSGWRVMKSAEIVDKETGEIAWDMSDSRTFIG